APPAHAGYNTTPGEDSIKGNSHVTFLTSFDHVTITNASTKNLHIGLINPVSATPNFDSNLIINVTEKSLFVPVKTSDAGHTITNISNPSNSAPRADITLNDAILNALGPVTISAANGNIVAGTNGRIEATTLALLAPQGAVGSSSSPIPTRSTRLDATAR